jgi:hypothetical protein
MQQPLTTIARGTFSAKTTASQVVCRDSAAWQRLWAEHAGDDTTLSRPTVDFATQAVVGVFAGQRPSSGWTVEITAADVPTGGRSTGGTLTVTYRIRRPMGPAQDVLTSPFHIVSLPRAGWNTASFVPSS